jgi:hypothetical protein
VNRIAIAILLACLTMSARAQQFMELPPGTVMGNVTTQTNPGSAVSMAQLIAAMQKSGVPLTSVSNLAGLGTGVAASLGINIGAAGSPVVNGGALGTPASGVGTNITGLPVSNISGMGTGVAAWLAAPTSANLLATLTTKTGSGLNVFGTSPNITTPTGIVRADVGLPIGQIPGTATNTVATTGNIGEVLSSNVASGSAVALTTGTSADVTSKSLTAGHWQVSGNICFNGGTSTSITVLEAWVNSVTAAQPTPPAGGSISINRSAAFILSSGQDPPCVPIGPLDVYLNGAATYFLSANASFTASTLAAFGYLRALRVQ